MGRICPILNHPLNDGVLINDDALVNFIQKRNVDFLPQEYVCRSCKREVEKLYKKKLRKATELHRSRYHDGSISTLKTSKDTASSASSTASESFVPLGQFKRKLGATEEITQNGKVSSISETSLRQGNANESNRNLENVNNRAITADIAVSETAVEIMTSYSNGRSTLQENQQNLVNIQQKTLTITDDKLTNIHKNVTVRKRTLKDFYTPKRQKYGEVVEAKEHQEKAQTEIYVVRDSELNNGNFNDVVIRTSQEPTTSRAAAAAAASNLNTPVTPVVQEKSITIPETASTDNKRPVIRHITYDSDLDGSDDDNGVIRRVSQEPTTSRAAAAAAKSKKRPISDVFDYDTESSSLSVNATNGTRLPHIQPLPPKRKPETKENTSIARDIMDEYIKQITGG